MNKNQDIGNEPITVVDVCCGKGIFSMLASYIFQYDSRIHQIVMLDKASIKWNHVDVANTSASAERRPKIELWYNCNLHEVDDVVNQLEGLQTPLALVGIHLCKTLSPRLVGIANAIGPSRCPFYDWHHAVSQEQLYLNLPSTKRQAIPSLRFFSMNHRSSEISVSTLSNGANLQ